MSEPGHDRHRPHAAAPWAEPERIWLALPVAHPKPSMLDEARDAVAGLAESVAAVGEAVVLVDPDDHGAARLLPRSVARVPARLRTPLLGRTGPTFVHVGDAVEAVHWRLPSRTQGGPEGHDAEAGAVVARAGGLTVHTPLLAAPPAAWATDGEGTAVASTMLLDADVNDGWGQGRVEEELASRLGIERVVWLPAAAPREAGPYGGLAHLHPWVRFTAPGAVAVNWQSGRLHPDHAPGAAAVHVLAGVEDARGRTLQVHTVPPAVPEAGAAPEGTGPRSLLDTVRIGPAHVLRPAFADPETDARAAAEAARLHPGLEQVPFPQPPVLRLLGAFSDLLLPQPCPASSPAPAPAG
ncbi:agmatine deiminase family protein [Micrococcus sp.]|uniref:agmatine deiminase family protein n=1 Tax=Micrococcus sp. TaxID=1271 RepID=UPI0026DC52AE|nr:agmatine deiminase family protein [Micrococcus sp.]MDO4238893.1 agmatine deiminase family protein [Micrococcus sp.]